jgi:hypothetical protein
MTVPLGLVLFLLGLASMTPLIGGGAQHAASAFIIAVGLAERDGLAVMIGAVAGIAALAVAAVSFATRSGLWRKVRNWLLNCARTLRLNVLASPLDRCCEGLADLLRLRWGGLLLLLMTPATPLSSRKGGDRSNDSLLRKRARKAFVASIRSTDLSKLPAYAT